MIKDPPALNDLTADEIRNGDHLRRAELEARILADQSQSDIADDMALRPEVVADYENRFFNVREWRSDHIRVWKEIIDWPADGVLGQHDVAKFWFKFGYTGGMYFLRQYLTHVSRVKLRKEGLLAYLSQSRRLPIQLKLHAAKTLCPYLRVPGESDADYEQACDNGYVHFREKPQDHAVCVIADDRYFELCAEVEQRLDRLERRLEMFGR